MAESGKRPWWIAPLLAGFGGVLGVVVTLGLVSSGSRAQPKEVQAASVAAAPAVQEAVTAEQLRNLTMTINTLQGQLAENIRQVGELNARLSRLEGRLEKR